MSAPRAWADHLLRIIVATHNVITMNTPLFSSRSLILATSACLLLGAEAKDLSLIRGNFASSGVSTSVRGSATAIFTPHNPKFDLDVWGLTAGSSYQFTVDGILEETFTANTHGSAHLDFRLLAGARKLPLDFDPRGKTLGVSDGTNELLSMIFSGEGEPDAIRVDERTSLTRTATEAKGRVELRYLEQRNKDRFIVHFHDLAPGSYELFVDGELQAQVDLLHGRSTMRTFEILKNAHGAKPGHGNGNGNGNSKKLELDFDPRGLVVDVVRDGVIVFSGEMLAKIDGLNGDQIGEATTTLTTTGVDADATGSATVELAADGEETLDVTVGALPAGAYDVVIGGTVRGTITVTGTEPASTGEVVFSTEPDAGELLLDFDPLGQTLEIRQGATVFLTGTIGLTLTEQTPPTTVETELPLLNLSTMADASGHLRLTEDGTTLQAFEVRLEGVTAGSYDLKVGGTLQGTILVADVDGVLTGDLLFNNDGTGLPLTFDPRGHTVTIEQGGTILLSRPL